MAAARTRAGATHACGAATGGQEGEWWKGAMWSVAGRQWDAGCKGVRAPVLLFLRALPGSQGHEGN